MIDNPRYTRFFETCFLIWAAFLVGCRAELVEVTAVPTPTIPPIPTNTIAPPTATAVPPTQPATAPASQPTPTPRPIVSLSVPVDWNTVAQQAVDQLQTSPNWQWQIGKNDQEATVTLINDGSGVIVRQRPLIIAVPFATNWEATTLTQAQEILANGHNLAVVSAWEELTPDWKALRIDGRHPTDADYPLQESWSLAAAPGYEAAVAELAPILQQHLHTSSVHLTAVGDLMLARDLGAAIEQGNLAYPFALVSHLLQAADLTVGNMESALGDIGQPAAKSYPFAAPPAAAQALAQAGFDIITLANNHAMDYGPEALLQGLRLLHEQNIAAIGAGTNAEAAYQPHFAEVDGLRLAFLGYVNVPVEARSNFDARSWTAGQDAPGLAWGEPEQIFADVTAVAPQADLVIVILHSGWEYVEEPSEIQMAAARAAIDGGADLVIGHHAHILQGVEFYNGGAIVYGLGNFAFDIDGPPETAVLNVWLDKNGVRQLELIPAIIQDSGQPRLAEPEEAAIILERVHFLTMLLN
ncbi:MAG: CapA family protein [Chloroflexi bacterium]|nr:CapA family protein [Chloroflexota bacterium]